VRTPAKREILKYESRARIDTPHCSVSPLVLLVPRVEQGSEHCAGGQETFQFVRSAACL